MRQYTPSENTVKYLQGELTIEENHLEQIREDRALCAADLAMKQQELTAALHRAQFKLQTDIEQCKLRVQQLANQLSLWRVGESARYQQEIEERKTWYYKIFAFFLAWCGAAYIFLDIRDIQEVRRRRDNPPPGDEQREVYRRLEGSRRTLEYLQSLSTPPETQEMRQIRSEVFALRKSLAWHESQVASKEVAVEKLRRRLDNALAALGQQSPDTASKGSQYATPSVDPRSVEEAELKARLAVAQALEAEARRRMQGTSQVVPFSPAAYPQGDRSSVVVDPTEDVIDAVDYAILEEE